MDLGLQKKIIVVSGGSSGIGRGIAVSLAKEGAIPYIIGRNRANVASTISEIESNGGQAGFTFAELTDPEACEKAISDAIRRFGRIDGIVNNAGVNDSIGLEDGNYVDFVRSLQRNLNHYYLLTKFALPELKKSKGPILNIGSKTSFTGQGGTSGYAAANGGRNALTREWAVELLPYSIRVNAVIVAECYTPLYQRWIKTFENPKERLKAITDKIPFENRMTAIEEIADTVTFLMSKNAGHITGQLIFVDGGYTHLDRAL